MKKTKNSVFIACSLDGYIADKNGGIDWLHTIPNPDKIDMGYEAFISGMDAIVMGRKTFETVCSFDIDWPYQIPVYVLSKHLKEIPEKYKDKAQLVNGNLHEILDHIHKKGHHNLYVDGGKCIQSFLKENLLDEMIISIIPLILGAGIPLFSETTEQLEFKCIDTKIYLESIVQNHFVRVRKIHT